MVSLIISVALVTEEFILEDVEVEGSVLGGIEFVLGVLIVGLLIKAE